MNRRALYLLALAGAVVVAGCSGGGEPATGYQDLSVEDFGTAAAEDGSLVVNATVANSAAENRSGTLYVYVEANGTATSQARQVSVGPAGTERVEVTLDVTREAFLVDGSLTFDWEAA